MSAESITNFVEEFGRICPRGELGILVNNAGVMKHPYEVYPFYGMLCKLHNLGIFSLLTCILACLLITFLKLINKKPYLRLIHKDFLLHLTNHSLFIK